MTDENDYSDRSPQNNNSSKPPPPPPDFKSQRNIKYESNSCAYLIYCPHFNIFTPFSLPPPLRCASSSTLFSSSTSRPFYHHHHPLRFANHLPCCFNVTFYLYRHDAKMVVVKGGKAELKKSKPGAVEEGNSSEKHAPPLIHPLNGILYCKIVGTLQICHVRA